jgi:hypothetical protein
MPRIEGAEVAYAPSLTLFNPQLNFSTCSCAIPRFAFDRGEPGDNCFGFHFRNFKNEWSWSQVADCEKCKMDLVAESQLVIGMWGRL